MKPNSLDVGEMNPVVRASQFLVFDTFAVNSNGGSRQYKLRGYLTLNCPYHNYNYDERQDTRMTSIQNQRTIRVPQ